jgi:hypothetical protein
VAQGRGASTPIMAVVAVKEQRITIYDAKGPILRAPVSTGRTGYETPVGIFSILQKEAEHHSNRYDDASMPFMERITWSGIALHAGSLPGSPASHGCIRLPYEFAEKLFGLTKLGMRVVIVRNDVAPSFISHPNLLEPAFQVSNIRSLVPTSNQPPTINADAQNGVATELATRLGTLQSYANEKQTEANAAAFDADKARLAFQRLGLEKEKAMKDLRAVDQHVVMGETLLTEAEAALAAASSPIAIRRAEERRSKATAVLAAAKKRRELVKTNVQPAIDAADRAKEIADGAEARKQAAAEAAKDAKSKLWPVSIFISLKAQRLYVRQGFEPIMDMPVTIRDASLPIGTHVYTAVGYEGEAGVRWTVVSLGGRQSDSIDKGVKSTTPRPDTGAAGAALDRVTIPQEVKDRFSQSSWLGSSLIISDEDLNKETGPATDFIVVSSTDPQGGLIMRKPEPPTVGRPGRYEGKPSYKRPEEDFLFRHPFGAF